MRKVFLLAAVALLVPSLALAAGKPGKPGGGGNPGNPGKSGKPAKSQPPGKAVPTVLYVLKGTLNAYRPASGTTDGSVTITVRSSNDQARTLRGQQVQIPVAAATKVVGKFAVNDNGIVKVRAPKKTTPAAVLAALLAAKAWQVVDQGPPKH